MNRKISAMRILRSPLIGILLAATACNQSSEPAPVPETETIQVTIGTGSRIDIQTRTELTDGTDIKWESDDKLALWARNSDGSFAFEGAVFSLWRYGTTWEQAFFRGEVPVMDPSGAYRYHAVSPVPASASAETRQATYEIPAVQDGTFHGEWDVMVADAVGSEEAPAPALVEGDNSDAVTLAFHHKVHLLRIRIPENRLGEKISQITLNFPVEVAGTLSVDFTDAAAAPTVTGSKSLTLRFDEPKDAGDEVYATIAPVTLSEADAIEIYATGTLYESQHRTIAGKAFAEGHITPIAYNIPEAGETLGTIVRLTLDETGEHTLGERIQSFTLRVEGASFDNGTAERTFTVGESGTYEMLFPQGSNPEALSGKEVTITYDSEHALLTKRFTLPEITPEAVNTVTPARRPLPALRRLLHGGILRHRHQQHPQCDQQRLEHGIDAEPAAHQCLDLLDRSPLRRRSRQVAPAVQPQRMRGPHAGQLPRPARLAEPRGPEGLLPDRRTVQLFDGPQLEPWQHAAALPRGRNRRRRHARRHVERVEQLGGNDPAVQHPGRDLRPQRRRRPGRQLRQRHASGRVHDDGNPGPPHRLGGLHAVGRAA